MTPVTAAGLVSGAVITAAVVALVVSMFRRFRGPALLNVDPGPYWFVSDATRNHARAISERQLR